MSSSNCSRVFPALAIAIAFGPRPALAQFDDPTSWATFDAGDHGVGEDPDGYRGAVFDGRYIYFVPADNGSEQHGEVLRYDTTMEFAETPSWRTFNPSANDVGVNPIGYWGAVFDDRYIYFVPFRNETTAHGEVLRYDTQGGFADRESWAAYDPGANGVGVDPDGYLGGAFDGRYVYFSPYNNGTRNHGEVLRYDTQGTFEDPGSWLTYDAYLHDVGTKYGYNGAIFDGRFVYFVPNSTSDTTHHGEVRRYDTTGEFEEASSWQAYDPGDHGLGYDPDGYVDAVFDGRYLYFVPYWNDPAEHGEVLRYDTHGVFLELASWEAFDPGRNGVGIDPDGYIGGVFDGQYVYFAPCYNGTRFHSEVLRYDTLGEFSSVPAWTTVDPNTLGVFVPGGYSHAVFDGTYIYFGPNRWFEPMHGTVLRYDTGLPLPVPAVSEWGMVAMAMLVLALGTIIVRKLSSAGAIRITSTDVMIMAPVTLILTVTSSVQAQVEMEWVVVGDPGNVGELRGESAGGVGPDRVSGAVDYIFRIGKYEVTNGQYIEFLNAVAGVEDTYGLYNTVGYEGGMPGTYGGIERAGTSGAYSYGPKGAGSGWLSKPVNFVSFYDAPRFANWMHNGQPVGLQDARTIADGAYDMSLGPNVVRKEGARFFVPTENECFKAAFYKGGTVDAGYWDYPTQSDTPPVCEPPPGRSAAPGSAHYWCDGDPSVGAPYYTTDGGAYTLSPGPYGTCDQAGNMGEWGEDAVETQRIVCGLPWGSVEWGLAAPVRTSDDPVFEGYHSGFRVASVYEADSVPVVSEWGLVVMALLLLSATAVVLARARRGQLANAK